MIIVTPQIRIPEEELVFQFKLASGPGGQNVNKVATAVDLRFDVAGSTSLPEEVRERLKRLAGKRLTREGELIISAQRFRSQERNREDAVARLVALIRQAAHRPKARIATRPSRAVRARRLEEKRRQGERKRVRRPVGPAHE